MRRALAISGFCFVLLVPSAVHAAIPNPATSTVPALVGCPAGDLSFTVIVRDAANNPVPSSVVTLSFASCPVFTHCSGTFPGYVWNPLARTASAVTGAFGEATFAIHQGGVCNAVSVTADGVPLANRAFASTDQDGDLQVTALDDSILTGKLFTTDGTGDFDGNGFVDSVDVVVLHAHLGHNCGGAPGQGANAGPDRTVECAGPSGTSVQLDGTASQGTSLTFNWSAPGVTFNDPSSATPTGIFPRGTTPVLLQVQSDQGPSQDEVLVTVRDTRGPNLQVSLSPSVLWPPNQRLVPIHATVAANDTCEGDSILVTLFAISLIDGDSTLVQPGDDVQGAALGTADFDFALRAERTQGATRTYTVCYQARDASGNATDVCTNVVVARDQGGRAQLLSSTDGWMLTLYGSPEHDATTAAGTSLSVRAGNDDLLLASGEAPSLVDMDGDTFLDAVIAMEPTPAESGPIEGQPLWARWQASSGFHLAEVPSSALPVPEEVVGFGARVSPNPASARASITYSVPTPGRVRLRVFDVSGRSVATLVDGVMPAGRRTVAFDGAHKTGASLYFYVLEAHGRRATGKFVLAK